MTKFTVDTTNKLFVCKAGVTTFDVKQELYSEAKDEWLLGGVEMGFLFPMRPNPLIDNVIDLLANTIIPLYAYFRDGWRIRPDEADHTLNVTGGILLVGQEDPGSKDPFVDTVGAFTVRINYQQPVQTIASVITSGSGVTAQDKLDIADTTLDRVNGIETSWTLRQAMRIVLAAAGGKASGLDTNTPKYRDVNDTKDRIDATTDSDGNRLTVTHDKT